MRHLAADGRPVVERATPGALHLLEVSRGESAATSPALGVEVRVLSRGVQVVQWVAGEPFRVVAVSGCG